MAMCRTESQAREALRRIGLVMNRLGLKPHPEKTWMVDLRHGRETFVFLGCTIRKKRSILLEATQMPISCQSMAVTEGDETNP